MDYHLPELQRPFWTLLPISNSLPPTTVPLFISSSSSSSSSPTKTSKTEPVPMAFPRLALVKNLHQRALVSSFADALLQRPRWGTDPLRRLSDQSSDGKSQDKEVAVNEGQYPKKWLWRNNGGLGNSLMQAAESISRVLKSLNLGGRVKEHEECYKLRLEMPGIAKEDVEVTVEGRVLRVRGEHREEEGEGGGWAAASYGYYDTSVMLPEDAAADGITAELKDGVLSITIPRSERPPKDVKEVTVL